MPLLQILNAQLLQARHVTSQWIQISDFGAHYEVLAPDKRMALT